MKYLTLGLIVMVVFAASGVFAQSNNSPACLQKYLELARNCYLKSLDSDVHGVRNSAIFLVVQFKNRYPDESFKSFVKKLKKMSQHDSEIQNRLHAYLAVMCLESPQFIETINPDDYENPVQFFNEIYNELSAMELAMN